jgi:hypothetical protein
MEFAVGSLIAAAAAVIAGLAYRSQLGTSFKRIHFSSFMMPFVIPQDAFTRDHLKISLEGDQLINPYLCVVSIENTGRSPILPSDFSGPLKIRNCDAALLRMATIRWNRPDILDASQLPDIVTVGATKDVVPRHELRIGPTLLNPRDKVTVYYIADVAPEKGELEVVGRIAGIEKIMRLPQRIAGISMTGNSEQVPVIYARDAKAAHQCKLTMTIAILPLLADPACAFCENLEVVVASRVVKYAQSMSILLINEASLSAQEGEAVITFEFHDAKIVRFTSHSRGEHLSAAQTSRHVRMRGSLLIITPPPLKSGEDFGVIIITDGECRNFSVQPQGIEIDSRIAIRFDADTLIDDNLAQSAPRLFLSNQHLYTFWQAIRKQYPNIARVVSRNKPDDA